MMSKQKIVTHEVFDARKLPDGVVAVCEQYGPSPSKKQNASWEYRAIDAAWRAGQIEIWKCGRHAGDRNGVKYVLPADAERAFEFARNADRSRRVAFAEPAAGSAEQYEAAIASLCEINKGITLMHATLERLAAAVESIGQQTPVGEQEVMASANGSTFCINGFHN